MSITAMVNEFTAEQPFLITPAGQNPDAMMVKILAQKAGLNFTYDKFAMPDTLKNHKTLVLVAGGSSKGLGAANIDKDKELERINSLIAAAKKDSIKIITMHIGGKKRRGKLSDPFNRISAENASYLIVLKDGDEDGYFAEVAKQKKIALIYIEKIMEAGDILKTVFINQTK
ncbi:MAG TPA: hypothetical protein ENN22_06550 [bacterium]|nr:hypothetical protein [bacterium]